MPEISDEHRDATLANLRAMNAALEEEAQMRRDAERWRYVVSKLSASPEAFTATIDALIAGRG